MKIADRLYRNRRNVLTTLAWVTAAVVIAGLVYLVRQADSETPVADRPVDRRPIDPLESVQGPEVAFSALAVSENDDVVEFIRGFLEACHERDYARYRSMVSLHQDPMSPDQFGFAWKRVQKIEVRKIRSLPELDDPQLPAEVFQVDVHIAFRTIQDEVDRESEERTVLAFKEEGEPNGKWVIYQPSAKIVHEIRNAESSDSDSIYGG
jgi:hypothetical protein